MADITKKYIDLEQLTRYDGKIKDWSNSANQVAYKTVAKSHDGNSLLFFKKPDAISWSDDPEVTVDTPDVEIPLGGASEATKLNALGAIVGATYDTTTETWSIDLDSGFDVSVATVVDALNDLLAKIAAVAADLAALDAEVDVATENAGVVTLKSAILQKDGLILNAPSAAKATIVEGYLNPADHKFYEEDTFTTEIELDSSKSYKDLSVGGKTYNYDGENLLEVQTDITLAKVATTGAAEDIAYTGTIGGTAVTNADDAIDALITAIATATDASVVTCETSSGAAGSDTLKTYSFYQGVLGTDTPEQKASKKVIDVTIPKDYLVKNAEVKTVVAADKEPGGIFENDDSFQVGDKYLDFTVNTADGTGSGTEKHLYINVDDLMSAISVQQNAPEVQLAFSSTNELSASIVDIAGTKITYRAAADATYIAVEGGTAFDETATYYTFDGTTYTVDSTVDAENFDAKVANGLFVLNTPAQARESVTGALTRLDGDYTVTGSVDKKVYDAVHGLNTTADVPIASVNSNGAIILTPSIAEQNGVVDVGTQDTIIIQPITSAEIDALFT